MILTIAGVILLGFFLRALYKQFTFARDVAVPWAPGWLPFFGHALLFGKDPDGVYFYYSMFC
jgi:hypothetical protein